MTEERWLAIEKKVPDGATFEQAKRLLTLEEFVDYIMTMEEIGRYNSNIKDGDERLVAGIIQLLAEGEPSTKRCTALLEVTGEVIGYFQRLSV